MKLQGNVCKDMGLKRKPQLTNGSHEYFKVLFIILFLKRNVLFYTVLEEYQIDVMNRLTGEQLGMETKIDTNRLV